MCAGELKSTVLQTDLCGSRLFWGQERVSHQGSLNVFSVDTEGDLTGTFLQDVLWCLIITAASPFVLGLTVFLQFNTFNEKLLPNGHDLLQFFIKYQRLQQDQLFYLGLGVAAEFELDEFATTCLVVVFFLKKDPGSNGYDEGWQWNVRGGVWEARSWQTAGEEEQKRKSVFNL